MDNQWQFADANAGFYFFLQTCLLSYLPAVRQIFPKYLLLLSLLLLLLLVYGLESTRQRRLLY
jgi:hypothetical protein